MLGNKILIIGCCGSGKTTLATELSKKRNLPLVHLDSLFWRSGWQSVSREEFDRLLTDELEKDSWIIDGNYFRTLQTRLDHCDTVIYLDYNRLHCIFGVLKRVFQNYGKTRADMGENCPERLDLEFLKYTWDFNNKYRDKMYEMLQQCKNKHIHILKSRKQCHRFLSRL